MKSKSINEEQLRAEIKAMQTDEDSRFVMLVEAIEAARMNILILCGERTKAIGTIASLERRIAMLEFGMKMAARRRRRLRLWG